MRLSTRARYGLRAILQLAEGFKSGPVPASVIAREQGVSAKYLHALLTVLKSAGLVRSVRGTGGGYALTRPPSRIRISEVVQALEGPLSLVECVGDERGCERAERCAARDIWLALSNAIESTLSSLTLEDAVQKLKDKEVAARMYHI
ncbi:MAG: RrF2 family transcriptional regulator [Candidatus Eiseniibacteriota bacterium]|nr:MAG: RrF2 family transcriptional regulator [Candidatus Eisenbacteria bacterium]